MRTRRNLGEVQNAKASSRRMALSSSQCGGQLSEIGHDEIRLMWCLPEGALAPINKRCPHTV